MTGKNKKVSIATKIISAVVVVALGGMISDYLAKQRAAPKLAEMEDKFNKELNKELDIGFEKINKTLPKEIAPNAFLSNVRRENKIIYRTYSMPTLNTKQLLSLIDNNKNKEKIDIMKICNIEHNKKVINNGYSFIYIYNSNEDNDVHRMVVDKNACSKYNY